MPSTTARRGALVFAAASVLLAVSMAPGSAEESSLSERLTDQILELNKLDLVHKFDSELERRKHELGQEPTIERANRLREMDKSRATTHQTIEDFDRAEADYNTLVDVKPVNPVVYTDRGYFYMRQG